MGSPSITLRTPWPVVFKPGLLVLFAALALGGGLLVATRRLQHTGELWLTWQDAATIGALCIAGLILHETGHAVAAKATGRTVERLEFGFAGGAVTSGDTTPWRRVIAIATGPLLEVVFGLMLWTLAGGSWAGLANPLGTAALMVLINGAGNLLPLQKSLDGARLLVFLRLAVTGNRSLSCVPAGPCPACTGSPDPVPSLEPAPAPA